MSNSIPCIYLTGPLLLHNIWLQSTSMHMDILGLHAMLNVKLCIEGLSKFHPRVLILMRAPLDMKISSL